MSVTSKIPNVAILGLLVSLCLLSDRGFGTAETIVDTNPHAVLEVGTTGILPCRIQRRGYSVEWKRQLSSLSELLVSLDVLFDIGKRDGPGYEAGLFNITDDYSLVIKDVKVQDEGLYMCSFSDYQTGKPFQNSTRVSVQASPDEPLPIVQECVEIDYGVCTLEIHAPSNLTCLVRGYYPDINLFFLHESKKITFTEDEEWYNADGTKNKNIKIEVSVSDKPYQCVASGLPGIGGNRSVSVIVKARPQARSQGLHAAAIVIPVLIIAGICLSIAIIFVKCYLRKGRVRSSKHGFLPVPDGLLLKDNILAPQGPVSGPELWKLVTVAKEKNDFETLRKALRRLTRLSNTAASNLAKDVDFFESLCKWKRKTASNFNQRETLYHACCEVGMYDIISKLAYYVKDTSYVVSKADIEHILWDIGDERKIAELLKALKLDNEAVVGETRGIREVINIARMKLLNWREGEFDMSPLVVLSLELDDLQCETNFYKLNMSMKEEIDEEEMKKICCYISEKHYTHLVKAIRDNQGEDLVYDIRKFVDENNGSLFNILQMLRDWVKDEECSNYDKRNKLLKAVKAAQQTDHSDAKWPPDDDLKVMAGFLSPAFMEQLCSKLDIKCPPQEASQEERFQALAEWRDNYASSKALMEKHTELFSALKEVERGGLVPRAKGQFVYKAELLDLAFHLFAQDLLPFTEALGISAAKLVVYRPTFQPSHMTQGTIGLFCKLFESGERSHLLKLLKEIPYPNVYASGMLALEIGFGEVGAISVSPANIQKLKRMQTSFTTSTSIPYGDDSTIATVEKKPGEKSTHGDATYDEGIRPQSQNKIDTETMNVLTSAIQVENHGQVSAESSAFLKHFKVWRERPRLSPFNFRLALANLLRSKGLYHQMSDFLRVQGFSHVGATEQIVDTEPHVVLEVGTRGILPCRIQRRAFSVEWRRELSSGTELLVSLDPFFIVGERDGPGYEAGLFNITDDYSLVIKDVKVQDEGLYMCSFSDYQTGEPFSNSTRVSVQAFPDEPFPIIQECIGKDVNSAGACTLAIHQTYNLTCLVRGYYPDINLFFLHGSEKMTATKYEIWNNADGTKNKNIKAEVSVSDEPYQCVASGLTGIVGNRSASVIVQVLPQARSQGPHAAAIVIPVLIIAGMCLSIAFIFVKCNLRKARVRRSKHGFLLVPGTPEGSPIKAPKGPVSKPELWKLVTLTKEKNDFETLGKALRRLGELSNTAASNLEKDVYFFESLCKWKRKMVSDSNQRETLYSTCCEVGMYDITRKLSDFVQETSYEVFRADIEHILWDIGDTSKITELMKALKLDNEAVVGETRERGIRIMINIVRMKLLKWCQGEFDLSPLVILSLKLDDLQCETNFYKLKMIMKEKIDEEEMKDIYCQISEKHYTYLMKAIRDNQGEDLVCDIRKFVDENNGSLFNIFKMLLDWVKDEECSHYEKRNKLLKAVEAAQQTDHSDAKWPPDDDLKVIAGFLSPTSMGHLCSKLHIKSPPEEASEEERFQALTEWRDNHTSSKDLKEKHNELFIALKEIERHGLVPRFKGSLVYNVELVDLAFQLFAQDLLPFTEALGICAAKLVDYRPTFQPTHMTQGTIGLVCKLFESGERSHLLNVLKEMPYPNVFASAMLALEISLEEVCAVPVSLAYLEKLERANPMCGNSPYDGDIQPQSESENLNESVGMLTSAVHEQVSPKSVTSLKHIQNWRKQPRLTPFRFYLALANYLKSEGNYDQISGFLRGDYRKGRIPFTFIHNILQTTDPAQREMLRSLIVETSFSTDVHHKLVHLIFCTEYWFEMVDQVKEYVYEWTNDWIKEMILAKENKGKEEEIAKKHKECNDKLVDGGFIDLARELMISERQLIGSRRASGYAHINLLNDMDDMDKEPSKSEPESQIEPLA